MTEQESTPTVRAFVARFNPEDYDNGRKWVVFYPGQPYALVYHDEDGMPSTEWPIEHAAIMIGEQTKCSGLRYMVPLTATENMEEAAQEFLRSSFTSLPLAVSMEAIELPLVRPWREKWGELNSAPKQDTFAWYQAKMAWQDANMYVAERESEEWAACAVWSLARRTNDYPDWDLEAWQHYTSDPDLSCGWCVAKANPETGMCDECTTDIRRNKALTDSIKERFSWWPHNPEHQPSV